MRKLLSLGIMLVVFAAFVAAPMAVFACGHEGASAKQASAKSGCTAEKANATQASAKSGCTAEKANAIQAGSKSECPYGKSASMASAHCDPSHCTPEMCAEKLGMTMAEFKDMSAKYDLVSMNVKGMTCGSCESSIRTSLEHVPGVVKVAKVSYKTGTAMAWVERDQVEAKSLVTAVANKGYEAEIVPAVAHENTEAPAKAANAKKSCAATCSAAKKANATQASSSESK